MKKILTLSTLALTTILAADDCCTPCCDMTYPGRDICTEAFTPPFYDLKCDWGVFVTVDFLYWYAKERNLTYAYKGTIVDRVPPVGTSIIEFDTVVGNKKIPCLGPSWDPGVRVGLGFNLDDGWDFYINWTYYQNKKSSSTSVSTIIEDAVVGDNVIVNPWADGTVLGDTFLFDSASAKWNLTLNQLDFELGRKYWLSRCFNLRPFAGVRAAWTRTTFKVSSSQTDIDGDSLVASDKFRNRNWGAGLLGGIQPNWFFGCGFSLYGNAEMALLWGNFKSRDKQNYVIIDPASSTLVDFSNTNYSMNCSAMQAILDLGLGLRWEADWCDKRYHTALDLGWEHHIWFDHNTRLKFWEFGFFGTSSSTSELDGSFYGEYDEKSNDLMMGGLVVRARFDF